MAFLAITFREIMEVFMVKMTEEHMWSGLYIINYTQPMAKLCVGLM